MLGGSRTGTGLAGGLLQCQVLMLQTAGGSPFVIASNAIELQLGF